MQLAACCAKLRKTDETPSNRSSEAVGDQRAIATPRQCVRLNAREQAVIDPYYVCSTLAEQMKTNSKPISREGV